MKNSQGRVRDNWNCVANVLENVDIACFISILCQKIRGINVTFCYTADKLELGKNIVSQGKWKLKVMDTHLIYLTEL